MKNYFNYHGPREHKKDKKPEPFLERENTWIILGSSEINRKASEGKSEINFCRLDGHFKI